MSVKIGLVLPAIIINSQLSILNLSRLRESLALLLIALLPFHALAVTVLTKMMLGVGRAPFFYLAVWKEVLLSAILVIALFEIMKKKSVISDRRSVDVMDLLIILLILLGTIVSIFNSPFSILHFIFGFKYDFLPLISFFILRRVTWSESFMKKVMHVLLFVGGIVAIYGVVSTFLSDSFFAWLGYSDKHSLYLPDQPIAAFQQIGGSSLRRIQSTMSGPNQLGLWLLIPLGFLLHDIRHRTSDVRKKNSVFHLLISVFLVTTLVMTFSRAAWIGALVMIVMAYWPVLTTKVKLWMGAGVLALFMIASIAFPHVLVRMSSSRGHIERPLAALQQMIVRPFGMGLGSAGPATNRTSEACVMLEPTDDPTWWEQMPDMCVFVGGVKVQPMSRDCHCPFLPENWYLQIGVEMGWVGMILYTFLILFVLRKLYQLKIENGQLKMMEGLSIKLLILNYQFYILTAVSIAALFLHAWEDAAIAYTVWLLLSTILPVAAKRPNA